MSVECVAQIRAQLDDRAAAATCSSSASASVSQLCVPHYWYRADASVPNLWGRRAVTVDCLVDAVSGRAATADPFAVEDVELPDALLANARLSKSTAAREALRCVTHNLARASRALADFRVRLEPRGVVYKTLWLVDDGHCERLVDSLTGGWYPLQ